MEKRESSRAEFHGFERQAALPETHMRRLPIVVFAVVLAIPVAARAEARPALEATCDRADALYHQGDKVTFRIVSLAAGEAAYRLSEDGHKTVKTGKLTLEADKPAELTASLDKPGFLQLRVSMGRTSAIAAAAIDPTRIQPTAIMPNDFDRFWEAGKKELTTIPIDAKLEHSKKLSDARVDCYKITLANVAGKRVHGWLSVPKGEGPFPAILTVPGAGVYPIGPDKHHAYLGALSMNIIIHDIPVDEAPDFYKKQSAGPLKGYMNIGMDDKDKSYYRAVILGCVRCNDYLTSRPDFNGKDLAVTGGSQGGALTLITSGVDSRVTLAAPNVAAMCDHSGVAHGRVSGWPHWLNMVKGDRAAKVLEASAYYDAVNFARKFKGKSVHGVGFIDTVCAPTTVYAAFDVHPEPKTMINSPRMGHGTDKLWLKARDEFWKKNMALKPPPEK
jgi:cephalosporin-C deacetylase-like acetyl esterase